MLPLARSTAVALGSPIKLLPFNTPAYYLGPYAGPTNTLTTQFEDSIRGLGVGGWKDLFHKPMGKNLEAPSYVIVWVAVQNRGEEEKGISVVWPLSLCLAFLPESLRAGQALLSLPELPASLRLHSSIPPLSSTTANAPQISPQDIKPTLSAIPTIPPAGLPPCVAVHSARSLLSLPSRMENTVDGVSREVSGFVDYVAKEREKERERIKRERDNHPNLSSSSQPVTTHANNLGRERTPSPPPVVGLTMSNKQESPPEEACGLFDGFDTILEDSAQDAPGAREQSPNVSVPYEIYPNFNSPWAQGDNQFSTLENDYEMNFGMGVNGLDRGAGVGGETGITADIDNICGVFTDDDFDFFDRPTLDESHMEQSPSVSHFRNPIVLQHGTIPPIAVPTSPTGGVTILRDHAASLQHPTSPPPSQWASTPRVDPLAPIDSLETVSSLSISSQSTTSTPQVVTDLRSPSSSHGSSIFDPIWFAPTHRTSDHKYASGKFSLPDKQNARFSGALQQTAGWRFRYDDATDPRKSVVRRLAGPPSSPGGNGTKWENSTEDEWRDPSEGEGDDWSDVESIDERSTGFAETADISVLLDRPCTPPPQFTPLGPLLLDCQFHHSHLLPLSHPLHSPSNLTGKGLQGIVPTISVPTPVSPPAMLGEKLKSWEAAMGLLVREVVENPLWAESWQTNNHNAFRATSHTWSTCQGDVSQLAAALDTLDDSHTSLEMGTLFDMGTFYSRCMFSY
jgi:mediator of RNA polymerase II transcription subunit 13, fungi type